MDPLSLLATSSVNVTVTNGTPPTMTPPVLNWPSSISIDSTLQISWEQSMSVTGVNWIFAPINATSSSPEVTGGGSMVTARAGTVSFATALGAMVPAKQGLTLGAYQVTVQLDEREYGRFSSE